MSCENVAYELIRDVFVLGSWQLARFEYLLQISVSLNQLCALDLKASFREFGLEEHVPELHIGFGTLCRIVEQRHTRHESKFGDTPGFEAQDSANFPLPCHAGVAEDIHQQRV